MSAGYDSQRPPPPGQGYYSAQPKPRRKPHRSRRRSLDRSLSPTSTHYSSRNQPYPSEHPDAGAGAPPADPRRGSSAPSEPTEPQNQLAPYDEEKAWAEWCRAYNPEPAPAPIPIVTPAPPPTTRHRQQRRSSLDERRRRYEDDMDYYDNVSVERSPAPRRRRRRDSTRSVSDYHEKPETKDLAPTLISSAGGAFLGRKLISKGALGTVGGAIAGAIGTTAGEHFDERKRRREQEKRDRLRDEDSRDRGDGRRRRRRSREDDRRSLPARERDEKMLSPRHRHAERPREGRARRYVGSSPDSYTGRP